MKRGSTDVKEPSRAAGEFHGNERQWREVFEHNPAMYFIVDAAGIVLSVNAFGASQFGYAASELVGQSILNLVFEEDDKEFLRRKISLCLETPGRSNSWEVRKRRKDGTMLWIREHARAMRWSGNQLIVLIASEDITELYWGALESSRLAAIVSSSDDAIVSKTLDGTITSWNAGATNILGYEADEMIGQPITRIIPSELDEEEKQILARLHRGERIQHYETVRLAKNGRRVDISLTVSPLFNQSGKVVGASKVARDITERKLAEQALRETTARLRTLTETAVDGVILIDARGVVLMFNPACEKLFGYSADAVIGENVKMLMPGPYRHEHDRYIANYRDTRDPKIIGIGREVVGLRKDGSTFPMDLSVGEARQDGGSIFVGIIRDVTERKSAERALRESAGRMHALIETAVDGAILIDARGVVLMFNPAGERLFGYSADEVIGKNVKMLMPEPYRHEHDGYIANYRDTRDPKIIGIGREVVGLRKDGSTFPMDLSVGEARQEGGSIFVGIIRDITERKSAERALRESAGRMRALIETAVDGAILIDARGVVLMFNPACERLFGYFADEVIGKNVKMLMPEPYRHEHDGYIANYRDSRKPKIIGIGREVVGLRADGSTFPMDLSVGEAKHQGGGSIFVGIIRDITERKSAERALHESAGRMRALIETAVDGAILIDARGVVLMFNPAGEKLFGYSADEVIGKNVKMLMPEPYQHEHDRYIANYLDSRKPKIIGIGREVVGRRKDGSTFPMDLSVGEARQDGESIFVGIIRDLTSRKRTEAELEQARAELVRVARVTTLGELTAAIAHEVNQPLTGLVSSGNACLRWLAGDVPNLKAARESVERMISAGSRAGEVISRIRALVGKSPPLRDRLNINDAITEVIALVRGEVQRNRISLRTKLSTDVPLVLGDRIQLQQVILNLMLNAIEAMSEVSHPTRELSVLSVKDGPNGALVTVEDSGVGLDQAALDQIFGAFYSTKAHGMGIGLAVSRTIVQAHGGRLWATPNVPRGATFRFRLPAEGEEAS
jgi:PAS domain S-box-containing protein